MLACLQYLTQLETLDLKRIGRRHDILVRALFPCTRTCAQAWHTRTLG